MYPYLSERSIWPSNLETQPGLCGVDIKSLVGCCNIDAEFQGTLYKKTKNTKSNQLKKVSFLSFTN